MALILTACAAKRPAPQIEVRVVYPALPQTTCLGEPGVPPKGADDNTVTNYFERVRVAGADCRSRLQEIHKTQGGWPQLQAPVTH